jgi:hypothetical protein
MTMREWWSKILRLAGRRTALDQELSEEMRAHLDFMKEEGLERGMTPAQAEEAARRHFGNATLTRERAREAWQFPAIESILQDLRVG